MAGIKIDIDRLSALARIELTKQEKEKFAEQISSILEYVQQIKEVDTTKVKTISHLHGLRNVYREDEVKQLKNTKLLIKQFPGRAGNLNKTKAVME